MRWLRRQLELDDEALEDLRFELVEVLGRATEAEPGILQATDAAPVAAAPAARDEATVRCL